MESKKIDSLTKLPKNWFYTVARNVCLYNIEQRKKRDEKIVLDENINSYPDMRINESNQDLVKIIHSILANLGAEYEHIFWLKHEGKLKKETKEKILLTTEEGDFWIEKEKINKRIRIH